MTERRDAIAAFAGMPLLRRHSPFGVLTPRSVSRLFPLR
jgi:hypothetical protein